MIAGGKWCGAVGVGLTEPDPCKYCIHIAEYVSLRCVQAEGSHIQSHPEQIQQMGNLVISLLYFDLNVINKAAGHQIILDLYKNKKHYSHFSLHLNWISSYCVSRNSLRKVRKIWKISKKLAVPAPPPKKNRKKKNKRICNWCFIGYYQNYISTMSDLHFYC